MINYLYLIAVVITLFVIFPKTMIVLAGLLWLA